MLQNIHPSDQSRRRGGVGNKRPPITFETVLYGVFLSIALLMLVIALGAGVFTAWAQGREVRAPGFVTALTPRTDADGALRYYPVITFPLPDGSRAVVQTATGSAPPAYKVDDAVIIVFTEDNPAGARIASSADGLARWLVTLVTGILAAAFLLASLLTFKLGRVSSRP